MQVCAKSEYACLPAETGSAIDAQFLEQIFGETCSNNMLGHLVAHIQAKMASQPSSSVLIISAAQLNEINSPFNVSQSFPVSRFMPADCML